MKHWLRHPSLTLAVSAALALASGTAAALGLGQIEVRSRAGQPLLAEIPVISTTPGELEQLQARLASPETFARVGLQAPQGLVTDLRFSVASDSAGRPVIRVTTDRPVEQPLVTFLLEVDWGQGRLVREYSALVDTPQAVTATAQPPIEAPSAAPSNVIQRPVQAPQRPPAPAPQRPAAGSQPAPPVAQPDTGGIPGEYGPVQRGDTLSRIAARLGLAEGHTLDQAMIALLRANPDAFIRNDINLLKQGAVLRVPQAAEVAAVDAAQASEIVRERMRQWREARRQAVVAAEAAQAQQTPSPEAGPGAAAGTSSAQAAAAANSPASAGARLEIVPPTANRATRAGTQSGIQAGGEGQMLRQELQETKETLAARDAELQELKSRVAELEKLQGDQQKLLALKNSELAAAQQRLATTGRADAAPPAGAGDAPGRDSLLPWLLGGAALLALLLGGWWMRRRSATQSPFRAPTQSAASDLAAAFPLRDRREPDERPIEEDMAEGHGSHRRQNDEDLLVVPPHGADDGTVAPIASSHAEAAARDDGHASEIERAAALSTDATDSSDASPTRSQRSEEAVPSPTWHAAPTPVAPVPLVDTPPSRIETPPSGSRKTPVIESPLNERLELAQAYLDLGDHDSARQLLGEVAISGDPASRQRARRMLREID